MLVLNVLQGGQLIYSAPSELKKNPGNSKVYPTRMGKKPRNKPQRELVEQNKIWSFLIFKDTCKINITV